MARIKTEEYYPVRVMRVRDNRAQGAIAHVLEQRGVCRLVVGYNANDVKTTRLDCGDHFLRPLEKGLFHLVAL